MVSKMSARSTTAIRQATYVAGFFLTISFSLPAYFESSFLNQFLTEKTVGWVFAIGAALAVIAINLLPQLISRHLSWRQALVWLTLAGFISTLPLMFYRYLPTNLVISAFILFFAFNLIAKLSLDIYLEHFSSDAFTGQIRGLYFTAINLAWLCSPFLASRLLGQTGLNFHWLFILAGLFLLPLLFIAHQRLPETPLSRRQTASRPYLVWKKIWLKPNKKERSLRQVLIVEMMLNFFFAIMVVYSPIYLNSHIGLSNSSIGIIFTLMLLPFVLLELPLGQLADRHWGEKEIIIGGLLLMSATTAMFPFIDSLAIWPWALLLFINRSGAAMLEIGKETYLFKNIDHRHPEVIAISRTAYPLSYLLAPLFAFGFLLLFPLRYIFLAVSLLLLLTVSVALRITDTR